MEGQSLKYWHFYGTPDIRCSLIDIWSFVYSSSTDNNNQRNNITFTWLHIIYATR